MYFSTARACSAALPPSLYWFDFSPHYPDSAVQLHLMSNVLPSSNFHLVQPFELRPNTVTAAALDDLGALDVFNEREVIHHKHDLLQVEDRARP